ncbi:membrane protein insertase YidC [Solibacillus sp. MA9]|uniref:Membrane protein insertase YidC n=1 Tax=Solibacillus palustris TaxID=2908203 RepID=A0ABS9UF58_9BACL|nr:membrane protein insertase YidC [Solibacillus sp. MA9]MCH7322570.1 membrane protein insertase YidC [Solibacillus sp. MA9]
MKKLQLSLLLLSTTILLAGCQSVENKEGFFYGTFVKPMNWALDTLGNAFDGSYGLTIIAITLIVRLILLPFMLKTYKSQSEMKVKMDRVRPQMTDIQTRLKEAKTQEEKMSVQQEMMALYKEHNLNPLNVGCLPTLIQMPIVMGLYFAILNSTEIKTHSFLWFDLGSPDLIMTAIAGIVYFIQARVSLQTVPEAQKAQMKLMIYISPIMIVFISLSSMAALPLYWAVGGAFLIIQTYIGRKLYPPAPVAEKNE